jgi:hypothetical protein
MVKHLAITIEQEQYYCKPFSNDTIQINVTTSESYRKLIRQLQQERIVHHTYHIREERACKIVIQNLHHSVDTDEIIDELENKVILSAIY